MHWLGIGRPRRPRGGSRRPGRRRWQRCASGDRDRGAVAIFLALTLTFILIPLGGLVLDIGVQRVARRDAQAVADVAAMDAARSLSTGSATDATATAAATASAARQVGAVGVTAPTVRAYVGHLSNAFVSDQSLGCAGSPYNQYFTNSGSGNAVLVVVSSTVNYAIMGGSGGVCRSSIASTSNTACFKMGSYAATVKSGDSTVLGPLNSIFGANLSLLSYQGIANSSITLAQLAANARFGTATSLLTGKVTASNLILATIDVLTSQDPSVNAAAITALNTLATSVSSLPAVQLSQVLSVNPNDTAALATKFNVLDLVAGAVLVADGKHAVSIPNLWANVAGTGETSDAELYIQEGASMACGEPNSSWAQADNAQMSGFVKFDKMNSPSINLGLGTNLKTGIGDGELDVSLAPAHGALVSPPNVHCGAGTTADPTTMTVDVSSALASLGLTTHLPVTGNVSIVGLGVVTLNLVVDATVRSVNAGQSGVANLAIPPNDTTPISTGSTVRLDPAAISVSLDPSSSASLLGAPLSLTNALLVPTLNSVLSAVNSVFVPKTVAPLTNNINTMLMGPVAKLLGLDVGGADVYGIGATCGVPKVVG